LLAFVVVDWANAAPIPTTLNAAPHISAAACDLTSPIVNSSSLFGLSVLAGGWLAVRDPVFKLTLKITYCVL
jgi:hypothetical protein